MGNCGSQPNLPQDTNQIYKDVFEHFSLTPLGYMLSPDEIRELCRDGHLIQVERGGIIFDHSTSYQPADRSAVECMWYFGVLCYGLAEVQTFDHNFNRTAVTVSTGTLLLAEHLFETGKRHSLNRGYDIIAKTQCTIFLVNLKTF
eukprot:UN02247